MGSAALAQAANKLAGTQGPLRLQVKVGPTHRSAARGDDKRQASHGPLPTGLTRDAVEELRPPAQAGRKVRQIHTGSRHNDSHSA
jgi:hypothetical protein